MENPKISETTREKLEDAAVSVFMEQYAKALDAGIDKKIEECAEDVFPPELEERCRALIQQEYAKERSRKRRKSALRILRSAAVIAVALLSLCSVLFMTVEAFRLPVMNFFVQKTDRYWQIGKQENANQIPDVFNPEDPLRNVIPDEYVLTNLIGSWENGYVNAEYVNQNNAGIILIISPVAGNTQVDMEDASATPHKVLGHDGVKSIEKERIRISWMDEESNKIITLYATDIAEEMVEIYAETVAELLA